MDNSSDEDDNPYNFEARYKKMEMEFKKKRELRELREKNSDGSEFDTTSTTVVQPTKLSSKSTHFPEKPTTSVIQSGKKTQASRKCQSDAVDPRAVGPVICIGDFDDGYNVPLPKRTLFVNNDDDDNDFPLMPSSRIDDDCDDDSLINREMSVKVYWCNQHVHRFTIRMFQSIESIYKFFSEKEKIDEAFILLELNKKHLSPLDTPNSINYKISDFIDGNVGYRPGCLVVKPKEEPTEDEVKVRIIRKDVKKPMFMFIKKTDKMQVLYIQLSEKLCLQLKSFTLLFDGETVKYSDTVESLDLEGDECFDLIQKQ